MTKPYHKYIFDQEKRVFLGRFDEMYRQEEIEKFDSWGQEDSQNLSRQFCLTIISRYNFNSILDFGCGKGHFTNLLKKENNTVSGVDISEYVIAKSQKIFPEINFSVCTDQQFVKEYNLQHDLIISMEVLSYMENWKSFIKAVSEKTKWFFISLYLPDNPIGFVKSFDELRDEIEKYFIIETELFVNRCQILLFSRVRG